MTAPTPPAEELKDLYRDLILDHARQPRHFGRLDHATHSAEGINPLCGDRLKLYLELDPEQRIRGASFEGSGCAISVASASLMTDAVIGLSGPDALDLAKSVVGRLTSADAPEPPGRNVDRLRALEGVREFPSRVKCATLAWHALRSAVAGDSQVASTE